MLGFHSADAEWLRKLLKSRDPNNQAIATWIATYEFVAHFSEIYNQRFLNMNQLITWKNISLFKKQALKNLTFFRDLKLAQLERKRKKMKNWQKTYLDQKTHDILFISVCGFVGACEYIINLAKLLPKLPRNVNRTFAISPAWSTQTFGEGWFAFVRRRGFDKAATYECALINNLMSKFIKEALKNNPMYEEEDVGEINDGNGEKLGLREMIDMLKKTRKHAIPAFTNRSIIIPDHSDSSISEEATPSHTIEEWLCIISF